MIKVKANLAQGQVGFYGIKRRYDGDVFEVESKDQLGSWMEVIEEPKKPKKPGRPKKEVETVDEAAEGGE